jgi:predicted nucleic acid-binding OB-fold protein
MSEQVTQGDAIGTFMELYWDDLTPEQINYLGQTQDEVYLLETRLEKIQEIAEKIEYDSLVDDIHSQLLDVLKGEPDDRTKP